MNRFPKNERLCSRKQIETLFATGESFLVYPFKVIYADERLRDERLRDERLRDERQETERLETRDERQEIRDERQEIRDERQETKRLETRDERQEIRDERQETKRLETRELIASSASGLLAMTIENEKKETHHSSLITHHSSLITHHSSLSEHNYQLLISVPKRRIKKAVLRNLVKRRTREAWRLHKDQLPAGSHGGREIRDERQETKRQEIRDKRLETRDKKIENGELIASSASGLLAMTIENEKKETHHSSLITHLSSLITPHSSLSICLQYVANEPLPYAEIATAVQTIIKRLRD